jgi:hypothetical protein
MLLFLGFVGVLVLAALLTPPGGSKAIELRHRLAMDGHLGPHGM